MDTVFIYGIKKNIIKAIGSMINKMDLVCIIKTGKKLKDFGTMGN